MKPITPLIIALLTTTATASAPTMTVERITTQNGKEIAVPVKEVRPGDLIQRTVTAKTDTDRDNARLVVPIDKSLNYVKGSAQASANGKTLTVPVLFSLSEKGPFSAEPTKTITVTENGKTVTKTVPADPNEYRAIRFDIGTAKASVNYKVTHRVVVR